MACLDLIFPTPINQEAALVNFPIFTALFRVVSPVIVLMLLSRLRPSLVCETLLHTMVVSSCTCLSSNPLSFANAGTVMPPSTTIGLPLVPLYFYFFGLGGMQHSCGRQDPRAVHVV